MYRKVGLVIARQFSTNRALLWGQQARGGKGGYQNRSSKFQKPQKAWNRPTDRDHYVHRNPVKRQSAEGDGLFGEPDYVVDNAALKNMNWQDLVNIPEAEAKFSGISTLQLAEHKVISRVLVNSLYHNRKYEELTPVQARSLLPIISDKSMVVRAKTGTGKTAAFSIPLLEKVYQAKKNNVSGVKGLIISPTRELAQQIHDEIDAITSFGALRKIKTVCMVGGLSKLGQAKRAFEGREPADIIVGTPGRLLDMLQEPEYAKHFAGLKIKVLDEADRLLDIGFKQELLNIDDEIKQVHGGKFQTLLFSATTDQNMLKFAHEELDGNVQIEDTVPEDEPQTQELVSQHGVVCRNWAEVYSAGARAIFDECNENSKFKAIVFLPTVALVNHFAHSMMRLSKKYQGPKIFELHGQLSQARRQRKADDFRSCESGIMVTTDVVARGMDFPNVTHVVQLGTPGEVAAYIHRIGRTARIGNRGKSIMVYLAQEKPYLKLLENANVSLASNTIYEPKDMDNSILDDMSEVCSHVLQPEERLAAIRSLFRFYSNLQSLYKISQYKFIRDQESFGALLGISDEEFEQLSETSGLRSRVKSGNSRGGARSRPGSGSGNRHRRSNNGPGNKRMFW